MKDLPEYSGDDVQNMTDKAAGRIVRLFEDRMGGTVASITTQLDPNSELVKLLNAICARNVSALISPSDENTPYADRIKEALNKHAPENDGLLREGPAIAAHYAVRGSELEKKAGLAILDAFSTVLGAPERGGAAGKLR